MRDALLTAWRTNSRVTAYLVEHLPAALWDVPIPGAPRRTVRMVAGHLHNARCMWLKTLGQEHGIAIPASVDRRKVAQHDLLSALERSSRGIEALLELGIAAGGPVPPSKAYVWRRPAARRSPCPDVLRRARGPPQRPDRHGGASARSSTSERHVRRSVAVDEASAGSSAREARDLMLCPLSQEVP